MAGGWVSHLRLLDVQVQLEHILTGPRANDRPEAGGGQGSPSAVLAGVASFLIQKETQESTTVRMQGMYVWMVK